jgi:hypothetical protein
VFILAPIEEHTHNRCAEFLPEMAAFQPSRCRAPRGRYTSTAAFASAVAFSCAGPLSLTPTSSVPGTCPLVRPSRRPGDAAAKARARALARAAPQSQTRSARPQQQRARAVAQSGNYNSDQAAASADDGGGDEPAVLADRIARAFVDACTPSETPYAAQVARFCREALHAYRTGYSLVALQLEMSGATTGIGRALASDEIELRSVWLALVYKTLRQIRFPSANPTDGQVSQPARFDRDRLDDFVTNIVTAVRKGYDMKRIQLEQALTASEGKDAPRSPLESAILNQSTRIIFTTLQVADQESGSTSSSS